MVNCKYKGCPVKNAVFAKPGEKIAKYCATHKEPGMIDIKNKKCKFEGCDTQPTYAKPGEKIAKYCASHKEPGMIDIKNKKCKYTLTSPLVSECIVYPLGLLHSFFILVTVLVSRLVNNSRVKVVLMALSIACL